MKFERLLGAIGQECPRELLGIDAAGVVTDPSRAVDNCIFVCIRGSRFDGHNHVAEAIEAGAKVIVAENVRGLREGGAALTSVNNTRLCASLLYNEWFDRPTDKLKIIGVTGTNGKSSVVHMLKAIFERAGYLCASIGTLGAYIKDQRIDCDELGSAHMTTPDPETLYSYLAKMSESGVEYVFMEVSSHALSQCRTDAIRFECSVFTNLTQDHLDFHGDMESYYKAKEKLFLQSRRAVVNVDDASGRRLIEFLKQKGISAKSCSADTGDFCALFRETSDRRKIEYLLKCADGEYMVSLPNFVGEFQIMNSLQAAAVASVFGISFEDIQKAFLNMPSVCGRLERVVAHPKQEIEIYIDYAHTPDALRGLLESVREIRKNDSRIVLLFGCGGDRDRDKRRQMGQIASRFSDMVIISSDNSRSEDPCSIIADILKGIDKEKRYAVIVDRATAIERAIKEYTRKGDILILAGKGHEKYQICSDGVRELDERKIVTEVFFDLYG